MYFPVVLFITLYKVVLTLSLWMKSSRVTIQMQATEKYFLYAGVYFTANQIKVRRQYYLCVDDLFTGSSFLFLWNMHSQESPAVVLVPA